MDGMKGMVRFRSIEATGRWIYIRACDVRSFGDVLDEQGAFKHSWIHTRYAIADNVFQVKENCNQIEAALENE